MTTVNSVPAIDGTAAGSQAPTLTAAGIYSLFGRSTFSLPDNDAKSKNGGRLIAKVSTPFAGLSIGTVVWAREHIDAEKGETEIVYSVNLPNRYDAGIKASAGDTEAAAAVRMWQEDTLRDLGTFLDAIEAAGDNAVKKLQAPRLVRRVKTVKPQAGPSPTQAVVQTAAAVAGAVVGAK